MIDAPDEELAALMMRCARRDGAALADLYRRTSPMLLGCLMRLLRRRALAEEALQDVFVAVWQRAGQFDQHRGRVGAWLVGIARYRAIDILRRERLTAAEPEALTAMLMSDDAGALRDREEPEPSDGVLSGAALDRCLAGLTDGERGSIELAFVEGLTHGEVALRLQRPLGTVKSWIRRGLAALKDCLTLCATETTS